MKLRFFACHKEAPNYFEVSDEQLIKQLQGTTTFNLIAHIAMWSHQENCSYLRITQQRASTLSLVAEFESLEIEDHAFRYLMMGLSAFLKQSGGCLMTNAKLLPMVH